MAKRKASTAENAASSSASPPTPKDLEQINKEHREYLLASIGIDASDDILPSPPKKRKISSRKTITASSEESDSAKPPRNAAKKPKASRRNASTLESAPGGTDAQTIDVAAEKPQKKTKKTKKPKSASQLPSPVSEPAVGDTDPPPTAAKPEKEKPKPKLKLKTTTSHPRPIKAAKSAGKGLPAVETPAVQQRKRIPLNPVLAAKIRAIKEFVDTVPPSESVLYHDDEGRTHVPERSLLGALMVLRADFQLPPLDHGEVEEIEDVVSERYTAPIYGIVGVADAQPWVVLKDEAGTLEMAIQEKMAGFQGWGLEDINLLEVELEMLQRHSREQCGLMSSMGRLSDLGKLQADFLAAMTRVEARLAADAKAREAEDEVEKEKPAGGEAADGPEKEKPASEDGEKKELAVEA